MGPEGEVHQIDNKARQGIWLLISRRVMLQVVTTVGGIFLARILSPADFGVFGITAFIVSTIALLGDFGLAPSLIQQKSQFSERDLQIGFTAQQVLISALVIVLWLLAPFLATLYPQAGSELLWLIRAFAFNLYLTTWRSISAVVLERKLAYQRIAMAQVAETVVYQGVAVGMAFAGYGVWSLVVGVVLKGLVGTGLLFSAARWKVKFQWDWEVLKTMIRFGVPFQLQRVVKQSRNWVTPTLVAALIGPEAVGLLAWSLKLGTKPVFLLSTPVSRVSFSHFSRLQDQLDELCDIVGAYLKNLIPVAIIWILLIMIAGERIISVIYTAKWMPALPALQLYAAGVMVALFANISITALNAIGDVRFTLKTTLIVTIMQLVLGVLLVLQIGFIGIPVTAILVNFSVLPVYYHRLAPGLAARLLKDNVYLVLPSGTTFVGGTLLARIMPSGLIWLLVLTAATIFFFVLSLWLFSRSEYHGFVEKIKFAISSRNDNHVD